MTADLDPRYRFENYIVGSANRLAVSAAKAVAQSPGTAYNPLFIYSSSGLGKTHLMIAVGHLAIQLNPALTALYITLDEFVEELTAAVSAGTIEQYKQRFTNVDLLLLDDVQFLAGRSLVRMICFPARWSALNKRSISLCVSRRPARNCTSSSSRRSTSWKRCL